MANRTAIRRTFAATVFAAIALVWIAVYWAGSALTAPLPSSVGPLPADLDGESVCIPSASGSQLQGWFIPGPRDAVVLLHGLHGSRRTQLDRARLFHEAGYAVLAIDFQAHGESPGSRVTFGYLESRDAQAAVSYVRQRLPEAKVAAIGQSLGGAAALLAQPPLPVDALVVEAVYPAIDGAVANRLAMRGGSWTRVLTPLLTLQLGPRLGFSADKLRPLDRVGDLAMPKFFLAGSEDRHTRLDESQALFAAAAEPKTRWVVEGAGHVDFYTFAPEEYRRRVLDFLQARLRP